MFLTIGAIGLAVLLLSLLTDDILDGLLPDNDWFSLSAAAMFAASLGLVGWATSSLGTPMPIPWIAGGAAGIGMGAVALRLTRSLLTMPTDATPTKDDLVGNIGRMVTAAPAGSVGEAVFQLGGQPVKVSVVGPIDFAVPLPVGSEVLVVTVLSATRVQVEPLDAHGL